MYFAKFLNAFVKPRNLNFLQNKLYIWNLQIIRFKMVYDMFVFWKDQMKKANTNKDFWKLVNKVKRKQKDCKVGPLKDSQGI